MCLICSNKQLWSKFPEVFCAFLICPECQLTLWGKAGKKKSAIPLPCFVCLANVWYHSLSVNVLCLRISGLWGSFIKGPIDNYPLWLVGVDQLRSHLTSHVQKSLLTYRSSGSGIGISDGIGRPGSWPLHLYLLKWDQNPFQYTSWSTLWTVSRKS